MLLYFLNQSNDTYEDNGGCLIFIPLGLKGMRRLLSFSITNINVQQTQAAQENQSVFLQPSRLHNTDCNTTFLQAATRQLSDGLYLCLHTLEAHSKPKARV